MQAAGTATASARSPTTASSSTRSPRSPTERSLLLRGYFEPTDRERAQGVKVPGAAHRALAQLAASGHLRLFLTTNFDRLLEQALEDAGVIPTVISSADSIDGAAPLAHSGCTVVKLNGDCRDTRIKNTAAELARYDASVDALLDRVLDEHGLIVCGWSADWDTALAAAFERCESRRYNHLLGPGRSAGRAGHPPDRPAPGGSAPDRGRRCVLH